jgi:hypothetical protein
MITFSGLASTPDLTVSSFWIDGITGIHLALIFEVIHIYIYYLFIYFYYCVGGTLWHFKLFFNISYLNSLPSFILPYQPSPSPGSFNRSHFSIYIHVCTVFVPYSPSFTISSISTPLHCYHPPRLDLICHLVLQFCKRKKMTFLFIKDSYTGSLLVTLLCMYAL